MTEEVRYRVEKRTLANGRVLYRAEKIIVASGIVWEWEPFGYKQYWDDLDTALLDIRCDIATSVRSIEYIPYEEKTNDK